MSQASNSYAAGNGGGPSEEEIKKIENAMPTKAVVEPNESRKLLVIDLVKGYQHTSVPYWNKALEIMGAKTGAFGVTISSDVNMLSSENLAQFDAVCFNNTVSLPLSPDKTPELCKSLMDFVKGGKGFVAIHSGSDAFYKKPYVWIECSEMIGGKFTGHPWNSRGTWAIKIDEPNNPLMVPFKGKGFKLKEEIYESAPPLYSRDKQLVLMSLDMSDETTKKASKNSYNNDTGISWIKNWGKGRVFYCSLGHNHHITWTEPILEHYLRGIQFAMGDLKVDATPKPKKPDPIDN
jgi:type 1 glutamine amidotransferase